MSSLLKLVRVLPAARVGSQIPAISITKRFASNFHQHNPIVPPQEDILQYREKPDSLSYFTGNFKYNDLLIELDALHKRFSNQNPTEDTTDDKVYSWKLRDKMSELLSIPLTTSQWRKITSHLTALASLPKPLPASVVSILEPYQRFDNAQHKQVKSHSLDEFGRAYAAGRRKESSARCYLVQGEGKILVNGMELDQYFQRSVDRNEVTLPLDVTETKDNYNAWILVKGGGTTGQAQAIKHGLGKALLIHNEAFKPTLRKAGCITRDPRVVERKKEGQKGARAKYTWVKR
ncbi:ribosomal protein S5 domain 2-type protein [Pilaira anomala]|nr:ribosomal protein S5 domain 2-type protein [Pilaira anomala]